MKCASTEFLTHEARIQFFNQQGLVNSGVFPRVVRFGRPDLKKEAIRDPVFGPTFHYKRHSPGQTRTAEFLS